MGLVFNDLGQETKEFPQRGLDMEELTLSVPTRPPMTSSSLFTLKSQGGPGGRDEQSWNTFLTYFQQK